MPTDISTQAVERSTYVVTASFTDENGDAVVPNNLTWSLVDQDKATIVNSREDIVLIPASSVTVVLSGADLAILHGKSVETRYFVVEGDYDSSLGSDLPINDEMEFQVVNIAKVPN